MKFPFIFAAFLGLLLSLSACGRVLEMGAGVSILQGQRPSDAKTGLSDEVTPNVSAPNAEQTATSPSDSESDAAMAEGPSGSSGPPNSGNTPETQAPETPVQTRYQTFSNPQRLLIYYGYPSLITDGMTPANWDPNIAAGIFSRYHLVVLGAGIEEGTHGDHEGTRQILAQAAMQNTTVFGYVTLGVNSATPWTMAEIKSKIDRWDELGANGIFFDEFGFDYGVSRARQNEAVSYAHTKGLKVMVNAWDPDDVFQAVGGVTTVMNHEDYYLCESYQIKNGDYQAASEWDAKTEKLAAYRAISPFKVAAVTTAVSGDFSQPKFNYAWYSAALEGLDAIGWGEVYFSAGDNRAPFRPRPTSINATYFSQPTISRNGVLYERALDSGRLTLNVSLRYGRFDGG